MAKASDNPFPSLLIVEGTEPSAPAAGRQRLYIDSTTHQLKRTDSSGTDVTIEGGGSGTPLDGWNTTSGFSYSAADAPTFVITTASDLTAVIPVGARIKLTQTTAKYFIVTAITSSTLTVYGGTDYTLANAAITSPYYSLMQSPVGFPLDPAKWTVEVTDTSDRTQASPVSGTWYNLGSITISIPIGSWYVSYSLIGDGSRSSGNCSIGATLSTANNSQSDGTMTAFFQNAPLTRLISPISARRLLTVAAKTSYYLNGRTYDVSMTSIDFRGDLVPTIVRATSAYL